MTTDSNPTKEILTREDKVPGGMVRVYYEIDEQERSVGEPRIVFVDSETAEEVRTKPLDPIETLRERQDFWLVARPTSSYVGAPPKTCLEDYLRLDIPISVELATYSKQWLEENNWQVSVERMIGCIEFRLRQVGILPHETAKTLDALKEEQKAWIAKGKPKENLPPAKRSSPLHLIIWNCYKQLQEKLQNQPSARQVWYELLNNCEVYDPHNTIEEVTEEQIEWYDTKGNKRIFKRSSLDPLLSRMKSDPSF